MPNQVSLKHNQRGGSGVSTSLSAGAKQGDIARTDGRLWIYDGSTWRPAAEVDAANVEAPQGGNWNVAYESGSDLKLAIGRYPWIPGFHDYAETVPDASWLVDAVELADPPETRGFHASKSDGDYNWQTDGIGVHASQQDSSYQINGDVTMRILFAVPKGAEISDSSTEYFFSVENDGSGSSDNISFRFNLKGHGRVEWDYQYGSNTNVKGEWVWVHGFQPGNAYLLEMRRYGGTTLDAYVNGLRLREVNSTQDATAQSDDTIDGSSAPDGGSAGEPHLLRSLDGVDVLGATARNTKVAESDLKDAASEIVPNSRTLRVSDWLKEVNNESGTYETIEPKSGNVVEGRQGVVADSGWSTKGETRLIAGDSDYALGGPGKYAMPTGVPSQLQITGTLTLRCLVYIPGDANFEILDYSGRSTGSDTHVLYRLSFNSVNSNTNGVVRIKSRHEATISGSPDNNQDLVWGWRNLDRWQTKTGNAQGVHLVTLHRVDQGDGTYDMRMFMNGRQAQPLAVSAGSGSISGSAFTGVPTTDGGSNSSLNFHNDGYQFRGDGEATFGVHLKDGGTTADREKELYKIATNI